MSNLFLKRTPGEEVVITTPSGDEIIVKLERIEGRLALLAFDAAENIIIHRREIHDILKDKPIVKNKRRVR